MTSHMLGRLYEWVLTRWVSVTLLALGDVTHNEWSVAGGCVFLLNCNLLLRLRQGFQTCRRYILQAPLKPEVGIPVRKCWLANYLCTNMRAAGVRSFGLLVMTGQHAFGFILTIDLDLIRIRMFMQIRWKLELTSETHAQFIIIPFSTWLYLLFYFFPIYAFNHAVVAAMISS